MSVKMPEFHVYAGNNANNDLRKKSGMLFLKDRLHVVTFQSVSCIIISCEKIHI